MQEIKEKSCQNRSASYHYRQLKSKQDLKETIYEFAGRIENLAASGYLRIKKITIKNRQPS